MHQLYDEDRLPECQPIIQTSNAEDLLTFTYLLTDPERLYSTIGVVTAWSGEGKTIAAVYCQREIERRFQSVLPTTIRVKVAPRSTAKDLATNVLGELGERSKGDNSTRIAADAARGIERNNARLLIYDEGDGLTDDSFEVVRYLVDKTGCPTLVVGLPSIRRVIERQEKFHGRAYLRMDFKPLSLEEVLTVVLPGLVFPRWSFDPNDETDRVMGEALWRKVCPNLRKLRGILDSANIMAKAKGEAKITLPLINDVYARFMSGEERYHYNKRSRTVVQEQHGPLEQKSVERHEAKDAKRKNKTNDQESLP
jgi:DNA transposition AAA+ family ATPase